MNRIAIPLVLLLCACGSNSDPDAEAAAEAEGEEAAVIHIEPEYVDVWGIQIGAVGHTNIIREVQLSGILLTNGNRTALIAPIVAGQLAERMVDLGSQVVAGQTLAALNAPEFTQAQTQFLQAFAQAELSQKDYERAVVLRERNAIEEREFLRRQALFEQHVSEFRAAEVQLHSLGLEEEELRAITEGVDIESPIENHTAMRSLLQVRTPISGVVIERDFVLGDHVEAGHSIFTVSDLSILWARLDAYEDQIAQPGEDLNVIIRTPSLPGHDFPGELAVIAEQVDPELRTIQVRVEVPNNDGLLRPNMYVQGLIQSRSADADRFVLPVEAVQQHDGHNIVFIHALPEPGEIHEVFEEREVEIGETLSDGVVILSGLDGTEEIVLAGAFTLKAEMTKGAGGHGHVH